MAVRLSALAVGLSLGLTACSSGSSGGSGGESGHGGPRLPDWDIPINPEDCHNPYIFVTDWQDELKDAIWSGDAACVKKTLGLGAHADQKINIGRFGAVEWVTTIQYALSGDSLRHASSDGRAFAVIKALVEGRADLNIKNAQGQTALQQALVEEILSNYSTVAGWMIQSGQANLEVVDGSGNTPLLDMLQRQKRETADLLIQHGANVKARTRSGRSSLQLAIDARYEDMAILLLQKGLDPEFRGREENTALHLAALYKMADLSHALMARGVNLNAQNSRRETALLLAVRNGSNVIAKALLTKGADSNLASNTETPLHASLRANNDELSALLIPLASEINARDAESNTVLLLATRYASATQVRAILESGADVNLADTSARTPLILALEQGQSEKSQALVKRSNLEQKGPDGQTALFFAGNVSDLKMLLGHGANVNAKNNRGETVLSQAVRHGSTDLSLALINAGADVRWRDSEKSTLLHAAIGGDDMAVARALLERGLETDAVDVKGVTPLFHAVSVPAINLLVQYRANVNHLSLEKETALLLKVQSYVLSANEVYYSLIESLVGLHADVNVKDKNGSSLLHVAVHSTPIHILDGSYAFPKLVTLLLDNGSAVNAADSERNTPLHLVDSDLETELLIKAGADRNLVNREKRTPLQVKRSEEALLSHQIESLTLDIHRLEEQIAKLPGNSHERQLLESRLASKRDQLHALTNRLTMVEKIVGILSR